MVYLMAEDNIEVRARSQGPVPHADTISVAVAEPSNGEVRSLGVILNQPEQVRKLVQNWALPSTCRPVMKQVRQAMGCIGK
jgi:hypothetical protein